MTTTAKSLINLCLDENGGKKWIVCREQIDAEGTVIESEILDDFHRADFDAAEACYNAARARAIEIASEESLDVMQTSANGSRGYISQT